MTEKFKNNLKCIYNNVVVFEIIDDVECDWGIHTLIQCPKCEELFTVDKKCSAFQNIELLFKNNNGLFSKNEELNYLRNSYPL